MWRDRSNPRAGKPEPMRRRSSSPSPLRRLLRDRRGNVLMMTGFAIIPLTFATGMVIDYSSAARLQTKLNAAADAAALAAVSQQMMKQDNTAAHDAAVNMFKAQIGNLPGLIWNDSNLDVQITGNNAATTTRTSVVTYTAKSTNAFGGVLGMANIAIGGTSKATATAAPNIDFYLALDTSPSMALPTTSDGLALVDSKLGCTFACHSNKIEVNTPKFGGASMAKGLITGSATSNPYNINYTLSGPFTNASNGQTYYKIDAKGSYVYLNALATKTISDSRSQAQCADKNGYDTCVYNADGTFVDSYWYALNQNVHLRVTDERTAASDLMTLAQSYAAANSRTYRAALYTFDHSTNLKKIFPAAGSTPVLSADLPAVSAAASNVDLVTVNDRAANGRPPNGSSGTEYLFTSFKSILDKMTSELPATSGKGSNDPGDTPQAFLFMVTDGMSDENIGSGRTRAAMQDAQVAQCTAIKNRGIQIAILYTEYTVASIQDDEPNQRGIATAAIPNIAPQLTKCASPGLMYTVQTDQSISDALQALFTKAVASARLAQ